MFFDERESSGSNPLKTPRLGFFVTTIIAATIAGAVGGVVAVQWGGDSYENTSSGTVIQRLTDKTVDKKVMPIQEESATTEVVKKVSPSVVSIIISKDLSKIANSTGPLLPFDNFFDQGFPFNFFFNGQPSIPKSPAPKGKK